MSRPARTRLALLSAMATGVLGALAGTGSVHPFVAAPAEAAIPATAPIQHVVVIFQENHTFDNVLGRLCVQDQRCDGTTMGTRLHGVTQPLTTATDIVANVAHGTHQQEQAIDGGRMDGWERVTGCSALKNFACLSQYDPEQIPNLSALARQYAISDRTFELDRILSFGAHVELASADLDGFSGNIARKPAYAPATGPGWGCDSYKVTTWRPTPTSAWQSVPGCIPFADGTGTWWDVAGPDGTPQVSPVPHIANIFDSMDAAGRSWKVYNSIPAFDVCSYFATCVHSVQKQNVVPAGTVVADALSGHLANLSFVLPNKTKQLGDMSQHNNNSMTIGDNWIGQVVSAIQSGPDWSSTAVFITYDDCGCFYDHVPPPTPRMGIRLPMVIVSPYVKPGYTDSNVVSFVGMLAFTEHVFGLTPMTADDATSYDYSESFDFTSPPRLQKTSLRPSKVPAATVEHNRRVRTDLSDPDDIT